MAKKNLKIVGTNLLGAPIYGSETDPPVPVEGYDSFALDEDGKKYVLEEGVYYPLKRNGTLDRTKPTKL